jgi:predicted GH43/DUF377 family glycosyl hydrolase
MKNLMIQGLLILTIMLGAGEAFGQFVWMKDARNPVLSGGAAGEWNRHVSVPSVLYNSDSARYEMWFSASSATTSDWRPYRIGFAVSQDGINWTMHPTAVLSPEINGWDSYSVETATVIRENGSYKMWYVGRDGSSSPNSVGYAISPDGIQWTKYIGNPVMLPGSAAWEGGGFWTVNIVNVFGGYRMYYDAFTLDHSSSNIGTSFSDDGITWIRDTVNNPILKKGASDEWDDVFVINPQVLQIGTETIMLYSGGEATGQNPSKIGIALSNDSGITWSKYSGNPVMVPSKTGWDASYINNISILQRGDSLHMWYTGSLSPTGSNLWRIGHATASVVTPVQWDFKKYSGNPVLEKGKSGFDLSSVFCPVVLYVQGSYRMWYWASNGSSHSVGYATSPDGLVWTKYENNPVFTASMQDGTFDQYQVRIFRIHYDGIRYHMFYVGVGSPAVRKIGYAHSLDGIQWTINSTAVLDDGSSGAWDEAGVVPGDFVMEDSQWKMWYCGLSGSAIWRTGYAYASDSIHWSRHSSNSPLLSSDINQWDYNDDYAGTVRKVGNEYHLWYESLVKIGYAVSPDGLYWIKSQNNPILTPTQGAWDGYGTVHPWMIKAGGKHYLYYASGNGTGIGVAIDSTTAFPDSTGENKDTGVRPDLGTPHTFILSQNYPNPFNPTTTIRYALPAASNVKLSIYDMLGREITVLVDEVQSAGWKEVHWKSTGAASGISARGGYASGVYFYTLRAGQFVETKKMILMK